MGKHFGLVLLAQLVLSAAVSYKGHLYSSNVLSACGSSGNHTTSECIAEYGPSAVMPFSNFSFIIQAGAGNNGPGGVSELALYDFSNYPTVTTRATRNVTWTNGTGYNFSVSYNTSTRAVSYTINGQTLTGTMASSEPINDVFIKTNSATSGAQMTVNNLVVNSLSMAGISSHSAFSPSGGQMDFLWLTGLSGLTNITLTGTFTLAWTGVTPSSSSNAATPGDILFIKFGTVTNPDAFTPEPGPAVLVGAGLALITGGSWLRRRPTADSRT